MPRVVSQCRVMLYCVPRAVLYVTCHVPCDMPRAVSSLQMNFLPAIVDSGSSCLVLPDTLFGGRLQQPP